MLKTKIALLTISTSFLSLATASSSNAFVIYNETFDQNPSAGNREDQLTAIGWCGANDGQRCETGDDGRGVIAGDGNPGGKLFWSRQISRILMYATPDSVPLDKQFSLDIQDVTFIKFDTDHTNPFNNQNHIDNNCGGNEDNCPYLNLPAIQVGDQWYVPNDLTANGNPQSGNQVRDNGDRVWDTLQWNMTDYGWRELNVQQLATLGSTDTLSIPSSEPQVGSDVISFSDLSGELKGFGIWMNTTSPRGNSNTNRRFDNYMIGAVPEPLTMLGAGTALAFGAGFKRKLGKAKKK